MPSNYVRGDGGRFAGSTGGGRGGKGGGKAATVAKLKAAVASVKKAHAAGDTKKVAAGLKAVVESKKKLTAAKAVKAANVVPADRAAKLKALRERVKAGNAHVDALHAAKAKKLAAKDAPDKAKAAKVAAAKKLAAAKAEKLKAKEAAAKEREAKRAEKLKAVAAKKAEREKAKAEAKAKKEAEREAKHKAAMAKAAEREKKRAALQAAKEAKQRKPITDKDIENGKKSYDANVDKAGDFLINGPHLAAVKAYTGDDYQAINQYLRGQENGLTAADNSVIAQKAKSIQSALTDAALNGLAVKGAVYRGAAVPESLFKEVESAAKNGGVVTFKGFTSTTVDLDTAKSFQSMKSKATDQFVLFRIRQKSAVPVERVSLNSHEMEALLPHNTRLRVLKHATVVEPPKWVGGQARTVHTFDLEEV